MNTPSFRERLRLLMLDKNIYPAKVDALVHEILALVREIVPPDNNEVEPNDIWEAGYLECRAEFLKRIGGE